MPRESLKGKSVEELREMKAKGEAKIKFMENRMKYLESHLKTLNRKERTHRLCTRGAMLEKYLGCPEMFTDEQVNTILNVAFHTEAVSRAIEHFKESNETSL